MTKEIKTVDYLISKGYSLELAEQLSDLHYQFRGEHLEDNLEDNEPEIIEELVSYIEMTEEEFKQAIEDELYGEEPEISFLTTYSCCYKIELMILMYKKLYNKEPYGHLKFDIRNNFRYLQDTGKDKEFATIESDVFVNDLFLWDLDFVLSSEINMRKNFLAEMTEEEIEEEIEANRSPRRARGGIR